MKDLGRFFSTVAKMLPENMAEIEKREVKFPVLCSFVARESNVSWWHLIFHLNTLLGCVMKIV